MKNRTLILDYALVFIAIIGFIVSAAKMNVNQSFQWLILFNIYALHAKIDSKQGGNK